MQRIPQFERLQVEKKRGPCGRMPILRIGAMWGLPYVITAKQLQTSGYPPTLPEHQADYMSCLQKTTTRTRRSPKETHEKKQATVLHVQTPANPHREMPHAQAIRRRETRSRLRCYVSRGLRLVPQAKAKSIHWPENT